MGSLADPPAGGGDRVALFAGMPFKTTGWAGYEKHRQHDQRSGEQREEECPPKTHPPMAAAEARKQAGDDVGENGYCHDLTATNSLSRVRCHELTVTRLLAGPAAPSHPKSHPNLASCRETSRRVYRIGERRDWNAVVVVTRSCVLRTWRPLACLDSPSSLRGGRKIMATRSPSSNWCSGLSFATPTFLSGL